MKLSMLCCSILPFGAVPGSRIRSVKPISAKVTTIDFRASRSKGTLKVTGTL